MNNITTHIEDDYNKLKDPLLSSQSRRHLEEEVYQLEKYRENHPNDDYDPTPLELYCDLNPHAIECKIYED